MAENRKWAAATALVVSLLCTGRAWAGPPFVTDDPEPVDYKHWEINLFSGYNHISGVDSGQLEAIDANYGLVPDVQIHLGAEISYDREPGGHAEIGYGDTELGLKYRFIHETDWFPQISLYPLLEIPTGDSGRGLGAGQIQTFTPLWLQKSFGPDKKWTAYGGGGFWYTPGPDYRNFLRFGAVLQRDLTDRITLGGEIYHETPSAKSPRSTPAVSGPQETPPGVYLQGHTAFNLGGQYNFDDHYHLLFSAGRDLQGPNHFMAYLALQLTF